MILHDILGGICLVDRAVGVIILPVEYFGYLECYGQEGLAHAFEGPVIGYAQTSGVCAPHRVR